MTMPTGNVLYYGDNLDVLRQHIRDESVDLIYLDPPFNSNASYSVLFAEQDGSRSAAQINAFEDTWRWDQAAVYDYEHTVEQGGRVADALMAMRTFLDGSNMLAYLSMMAPRLVELRRVLKPTGSIYLHCDPTASHYLKLLMDAVVGPTNFRNEIIWQRTPTKALTTRRLPSNHDVLLTYQKSSEAVWNLEATFTKYNSSALDAKTRAKYSHHDADGRLYQLDNLINPNPNRPNLTYEFLGVTKVWRWTKERMRAAYEAGLVVQPNPGSVPRLKRYLDEQRGKPLGDVWTDIAPLNSQAQERLGYPTQKPLALLERIINASCNPGDVVLDPFCGCGTAVDAAQRLGRQWVGIDITHLAINLVKHRLADTHGSDVKFTVVGEPTDLAGAAQLASEDPYQFQWWALGLVGARPAEQKKGADQGIDGRLLFHDEQGAKTKQVILSVKAGHVNVNHVRQLGHVVTREQAAIGVLISIEPPTHPMRSEAAGAGFYEAPWAQKYAKLQLLTIADLLSGKRIEMPQPGTMSLNVTHKRAPKANKTVAQTPPML